MVITEGSDPSNPGSTPGRTCKTKYILINLNIYFMENPGFDPGASSLLTTHSSNWANPPLVDYINVIYIMNKSSLV